MQKQLNRVAGAALAALSIMISAAPARAQWPSKPITYVVPFAPGGNTDTLARLIGPKLSAALGQPVIIENKPGAGGNVGSDFVAKANPDGHTILGGTISSHAINVSIYAKMPYDPLTAFEPVIMLGSSPLVLTVNVDSPYKSLANVIAEAKAKPGSIGFGSAGKGTSPHLAGELLKSRVGIDLLHVPYKGSGPALTDLLAGHVPMMFDTQLVLGSQLRAGKLRALAVASPTRLSSLPDVPTMAEAGAPGVEVASWQAVFAPAKTPKEIVQRLNREIAQILKAPDVAAKLAELAVVPDGGPSEALGAYQKAEIAKWAKVVKDANIAPE